MLAEQRTRSASTLITPNRYTSRHDEGQTLRRLRNPDICQQTQAVMCKHTPSAGGHAGERLHMGGGEGGGIRGVWVEAALDIKCALGSFNCRET